MVRSAIQTWAPLDKSWSCYEGGRFHCGECSTCLDRKKAFKEVGVNDPTVYANEEYDVIQCVVTGKHGGVFKREYKAEANHPDVIRWVMESPDLPYYISGEIDRVEIIPYAGEMKPTCGE
ncbi:7-cyano-7-deazaguanine synthase [compost metagenome]